MDRLATFFLFVTFMTVGAIAHGSQIDRAAYLIAAGNPAAALDILDTLPQTPGALAARSQAHLLLASQNLPAARCYHLRQALDFASMSSRGDLLEMARKSFTDEGCQTSSPAL
jgi:hypothetical protein